MPKQVAAKSDCVKETQKIAILIDLKHEQFRYSPNIGNTLKSIKLFYKCSQVLLVNQK